MSPEQSGAMLRRGCGSRGPLVRQTLLTAAEVPRAARGRTPARAHPLGSPSPARASTPAPAFGNVTRAASFTLSGGHMFCVMARSRLKGVLIFIGLLFLVIIVLNVILGYPE